MHASQSIHYTASLFQYSIDMTMGHELVAGDLGEQGSQAEVCSFGLAPKPLLFIYTGYWGEAPFKQGTKYSSSLCLLEWNTECMHCRTN